MQKRMLGIRDQRGFTFYNFAYYQDSGGVTY